MAETPLAETAFKQAEHQVGGHKFENGSRGSLVDDKGRFYKPLQSDARGQKEVDFYNQLAADAGVPPHIRAFFPKFFGCVEIDSGDGSGKINHAVMENVTEGFVKPSVTDIKMGRCTWHPSNSEAYIAKCKKKDAGSTSEALGFRFAGMQVYRPEVGDKWSGDRNWAYAVTLDTMANSLLGFVCPPLLTQAATPELIAAAKQRAKLVYGGPQGIIAQLRVFNEWVKVQTTFHFCSASVLFIYDSSAFEGIKEGDELPTASSSLRPTLKFVDFAHVYDGQGKTDDNLYEGLSSLTDYLSSICES